MPINLKKLAEDEVKWLQAQTVETQQALISIYRDSLREIYDSIGSVNADTLRYTHLLQIQSQLETIIATMESRLNSALSGRTTSMFDNQANRQLTNWVELERALGSPDVADMFSLITPTIPREALQAMLVTQKVNIKRFTSEINNAIGQELSKSVVQGESIGKSIQRLRGVVPVSGGDGRKKHTSRLQLISRMEISKAQNTANIEIVKKLSSSFPDLDFQHMVHESVDRSSKTRNHPLSWAIHGVKRNAGGNEPFRVPVADVRRVYREYQAITKRSIRLESSGVLWERKGEYIQGLSLPAHFNDRGAVIPFRNGWV